MTRTQTTVSLILLLVSTIVFGQSTLPVDAVDQKLVIVLDFPPDVDPTHVPKITATGVESAILTLREDSTVERNYSVKLLKDDSNVVILTFGDDLWNSSKRQILRFKITPNADFPYRADIDIPMSKEIAATQKQPMHVALLDVHHRLVQFRLISEISRLPVADELVNVAVVAGGGNSVKSPIRSSKDGLFVVPAQDDTTYVVVSDRGSKPEGGFARYTLTPGTIKNAKDPIELVMPTPQIEGKILLQQDETTRSVFSKANGTVAIRRVEAGNWTYFSGPLTAGVFDAFNLTTGHFQIVLQPDLNKDYYIVSGGEFDLLALGKATIAQDVVIRSRKSFSVSVKTADKDTGEGVESVVNLTETGSGAKGSHAAPKGALALKQFSEGNYVGTVRAKGYASQIISFDVHADKAIFIALDPLRTVSIVCVDSNNKPAGGVTVILLPREEGMLPAELSGETDQAGLAKISGVKQGSVGIVVLSGKDARFVGVVEVAKDVSTKLELPTPIQFTGNLKGTQLTGEIMLVESTLRLPAGRATVNANGDFALNTVAGKYGVYFRAGASIWKVGEIELRENAATPFAGSLDEQTQAHPLSQTDVFAVPKK